MTTAELVGELAGTRIGATFNQYEGSAVRRARLRAYLESRCDAPFILVGEAAGYRGARISGIPFTSERQLTGSRPGEATATIVHRVLAELELEDQMLLWNVVPTHPGTESSNRRPTREEVAAGLCFLRELTRGRRAIPVGRLAHSVLGGSFIRHPSHGGAAAFRAGLTSLVLHRSRSRHSSGQQWIHDVLESPLALPARELQPTPFLDEVPPDEKVTRPRNAESLGDRDQQAQGLGRRDLAPGKPVERLGELRMEWIPARHCLDDPSRTSALQRRNRAEIARRREPLVLHSTRRSS